MTAKKDNGHVDALELLTEDHARLRAAAERLIAAPENDRRRLASKLASDLSIHASLDEDIFYPAAAQTLGGDIARFIEDDIPRALEITREMKNADATSFRSHLDSLLRALDAHIAAEEGDLFPALRKTKLGADIGQALLERRQELQQEQDTGGAYAGASHGKKEIPYD